MIIDADSVEPGSGITADVCIIGSGAAGIPIAAELSRHGIATVVLAGGRKRERPWERDLNRGVIEAAYPHEPLEANRRRAFGGTTTAWGGRCIPFDPIDFDARPWVPGSGWPLTYTELLPYFQRAMEICEAGAFSFDAGETFSPGEAPMIPGFDGPDVISSRLERWSPPTDFAKRYTPEFRKETKLRVLLGAHAIHIQLTGDGKSVDHIQAASRPGREFSVSARLYVLAAGGLENPRLLLSSRDIHTRGIGNSNDLVGRYYMSHLMGESATFSVADRDTVASRYGLIKDKAGVYCRRRIVLTPQAQTEREIGNASAIPHRPPLSDAAHHDPLFSAAFIVKQYEEAWRAGRPRDFLSRLHGDARIRKEHWQVIRSITPATAVSMVDVFHSRYLARRRLPTLLPRQLGREQYLHYQTEHAPNRDSRVLLSAERDAFGLPRPAVQVAFSEVDYRTVVELHRAIAERFELTGTGQMTFDENALRDHLTEQAGKFNSGAHQLGTTRMSASPAAGVVDGDGMLHEVGDLFVAGGSVFATSGYANPTLTIVALSLRLAAHLRQRLANGPDQAR
jgi:choline dehydrogenase-like flavoprotein